MKGLAVTALIAVTLTAGLTGCSRFGHGAVPSDAPSPVVSTPASESPSDGDVGDVLADLDAVDDTVTQADEDGRAGDDAARTDDAP